MQLDPHAAAFGRELTVVDQVCPYLAEQVGVGSDAQLVERDVDIKRFRPLRLAGQQHAADLAVEAVVTRREMHVRGFERGQLQQVIAELERRTLVLDDRQVSARGRPAQAARRAARAQSRESRSAATGFRARRSR